MASTDAEWDTVTLERLQSLSWAEALESGSHPALGKKDRVPTRWISHNLEQRIRVVVDTDAERELRAALDHREQADGRPDDTFALELAAAAVSVAILGLLWSGAEGLVKGLLFVALVAVVPVALVIANALNDKRYKCARRWRCVTAEARRIIDGERGRPSGGLRTAATTISLIALSSATLAMGAACVAARGRSR